MKDGMIPLFYVALTALLVGARIGQRRSGELGWDLMMLLLPVFPLLSVLINVVGWVREPRRHPNRPSQYLEIMLACVFGGNVVAGYVGPDLMGYVGIMTAAVVCAVASGSTWVDAEKGDALRTFGWLSAFVALSVLMAAVGQTAAMRAYPIGSLVGALMARGSLGFLAIRLGAGNEGV